VKYLQYDDRDDMEPCFNMIDSYLETPPKRILDIGCGGAYHSQWFQEKYNCELWLLEGDSSTTKNRNRKGSWGKTEDFEFYETFSDLEEEWLSRGIKYNLVDANNINIPKNIKFDLVTSYLSCGFHYPAETYKDLIKKHTDEDSVCIMDFRKKTLNKNNINTKAILEETNKRVKLHFNFL